MRNKNEKHSGPADRIDGKGTLQMLILWVFLVPTFAAAAWYSLPFAENSFYIPVLLPTAMAFISLWQSFGCYRDITSLFRKQ